MKRILVIITAIWLYAGNLLAQGIIDRDLLQALQTSLTPVEVVVTFHGDGAPTQSQLSILNKLGITKGITFKALPIAGVLATAAQVEALAANPAVKSVYLNKKLTYFNYNGTHLTGVQRLRKDKEMTSRNKGLPVSGKGVTVMINDSGVDGTHEDIKLGSHLVQNVMASLNLHAVDAMLPITYLENVPNSDTNSGHGTHCAGSVGGNGAMSGGMYEGVAPGANLLGYGSGAALFVLDGIGGFDYALTHQAQYGIRVISNSWGSSGDFDPSHPINLASKKAYDRGMVVLFAAGNEGPGSDTHNPYAIAPWVISVGAGDKYGQLADFSSRGVKGEKGTFTLDGESWIFENRPTLVAPGVDIISTRVLAPVSSLSAQQDVENLDPAHVPFYTHMSGTSMATPHTAGIVALMLEANPSLSPAQVKDILQKTATNMPNRESWEVGAGYVNAYAAVDHVFRNTAFGGSLNMTRRFNSSINKSAETEAFTIDYNPLLTATNQKTFAVAEGTTGIEAKIIAGGLASTTGNPVNLILVAPDGTEYRAGIPVAFALYMDRSVAVAAPMPGSWTIKIEGLQGIALPEKISGNLTTMRLTGTTGLNDVVGHPAEASIKMAISARLMDGLSTGFKPNDLLKRIQLADYLLMGQAVRQYMPTTGAVSFTDVTGTDILFAESVTAKGAALKDRLHEFNGVMTASGGKFNPSGYVNRASLAYSLVQSLGLQQYALERNGKPVTVKVDGKDVDVKDAKDIPAGLEGYVSIALEMGLINAYYTVKQGPLDLFPTLEATFKPLQNITRAEFAVIVTRTHTSWSSNAQPVATTSSTSNLTAATTWAKDYSYPNPFSESTTINYSVEKDGFVNIEVYDVVGNKIRTLVSEQKQAGNYNVKFDGSSLPGGTYIYHINAGGRTTSNKMVITR